MNILATGGGGYLGSVLVPMLLDAEHSVTVVDTFTHGVPSLAAHMYHMGLTVVRDDVRGSAMLDMVRKFDVVLPLAALVGAPACERDQLTACTVNHVAVQDIVRHSSADQIIIYPCTNSGYGTAGQRAACTEDDPLRPISYYGRTKVDAEQVVLAHGGTSLRLATLFGCSPRMRLDLMVNDWTYRAVHDRSLVLFEGGYRRNFVHVRDAAAAFMFALLHYHEMAGRAYNVGDSAANMTKRQLAERIKAAVPEFTWTEAAYVTDPDQRDYLVSNARIEALGWRAMRRLDDGIAELVRAFRAMPFERTPWRNV